MKTKLLWLMIVTGLMIIHSCSDKDEAAKEEVDPEGAPPKKWVVNRVPYTRVFYDEDVAIYYDEDMDPKITWTFKYIGDMWRHMKEVYQCTPDQRLYAVLHGNQNWGTASYYYSDSWDYRNTIICYSSNWNQGDAWPLDLITHEMFHIVETVSFGANSNSAGYGDYPNGIWGDSQFAPIFQYDVYKHFGMTADAQRWEREMETSFSNSPFPHTYWSANWFLPIYKNYGETEVLKDFFKLVGEHFPDNRKLNMGEFVHFFSGAAGTDLKEYAVNTFGWPEVFENELIRAKEEFPMISYE